ncbi:MAG: hypothetical protein IPL61_24200 [Myxococcales bacterium]|nr:hypothetical protein [Myxococcales bacterium]
MIATHLRALHPELRAHEPPFALAGAATELRWPASAEDDDAARFVRAQIVAFARRRGRASR